MKLESAALVLNKKKKWAKAVYSQILNLLKAHHISILSPSKSQILITIGGDGTILYHKFKYSQPIFAIGSDTSFICNAHKDDWREKLEDIISNGFRIEKRAMLSSWLDGKKLPDALNEVAIRNREHRILNLRLFVGKKRYAFEADGILFSTATGSSAYAYSCGGSEMPHLSKKFQIVAIAPYRRRFKPLIIKSDEKARVHVDSTCTAGAVVDGQYEHPVKRKCCLEVKLSKREFLFARSRK